MPCDFGQEIAFFALIGVKKGMSLVKTSDVGKAIIVVDMLHRVTKAVLWDFRCKLAFLHAQDVSTLIS